MKIIHLSASDFRGAIARSASTLHAQLLARGVQSRFFAKDCFLKETERIPCVEALPLAQFTQKTCLDNNLANRQASGFTLGCPGSGQLNFQALNDADLIHLHDIRGLFSPQAVNRLIASGKPIVWSLSDMWAFTGGCHYALECGGYAGDCKNCPQLRYDDRQLPALLQGIKRSAFDSPNLHLVSTTQWLAGCASASRVFRNAPVHIIPPVVSDALCLQQKCDAKAQLGLAPEVFTLLVICETTGTHPSRWEGVKQLLENCGLFNVFTRLARKKQLRVLILGSTPEDFKLDYGVMHVGPVGDFKKLSSLLNAADLAVLPHFEENNPHIILEAAACGTPVIAMNTGGVNEFIQDGITGKLVTTLDSRHMAEEISYTALHRSIQNKWQENCASSYAKRERDGVEQHQALYCKLLETHSAQGRQHAEIVPIDPHRELADLLSLFQGALSGSFEFFMEDSRQQAESAERAADELNQILQNSVDKLTAIERRMQGLLRHEAPRPKLESCVISIGKHRNHLARLLREKKTKDEARSLCIPFSPPAVITPKPAKPAQNPKVHDRLLKWAYESYFGRGYLSKPGVLEQHAPRPMTLEKFPKPRVAVRKLPTIAIVTPSYMQGRFIEETLRSVVDQDYPKLRYAVQDAASTDETAEILKKHSTRVTTWVSEPDTGQARAVACGFEKISGDIMAWLNSDDLLMPGALRFVGEYFQKHPDVDALYGHRVIINEHSQEIGRWVMPPHDPEVLNSIDYVPQETLFWRKSLWKKAGGISPKFRFALDWDLLLRFQTSGANIVRVPYYLGCFRVHTLQKTSAQMETIGSEEVNHLRAITRGACTDPVELGALSQRVLRQSALCAWLLRRGIRW